MDIYILQSDADRYPGLVTVDDQDWARFTQFDGRSLAPSWSPVRVLPNYEFSGQKDLSDFPNLLTHVPVFSKNASQVLGEMLKDGGELLPLICAQGTYLAYNVTQVVDALDIERSELVRFSNGRIMDAKHYTFHPDKLPSANIFKIPQTSVMDVFVTSRFVDVATTAGLSGFLFRRA